VLLRRPRSMKCKGPFLGQGVGRGASGRTDGLQVARQRERERLPKLRGGGSGVPFPRSGQNRLSKFGLGACPSFHFGVLGWNRGMQQGIAHEGLGRIE
jgi:hypothetical protein